MPGTKHHIVRLDDARWQRLQELAKRIGKPGAYRAVANAVGKNPLAPTIPCHRVIRADGSLGGYSAKGGIKAKRKLLLAEGVTLKN